MARCASLGRQGTGHRAPPVHRRPRRLRGRSRRAARPHSDLGLLRRYAPRLHYDARETARATSVERLTRRVAGRALALGDTDPGRSLPDVTYGRSVADRRGRTWLQYWFLYATNPQDRGIVHTGRHEGDWEVVQVALDGAGRPVASTYAQHSWGEACAGWSGEVYVAHGSHASYRTAGEHGRPWPDPDDEARGDGRVVRPRVRPFGRWAAWPGRWGRSVASFVPGEQTSPRGPAFQPRGPWPDPAAFHARARRCGSGAPGWPPLAYAGVGAVVVLLGAVGLDLKFHRRRSMTRRSRAGTTPCAAHDPLQVG